MTLRRWTLVTSLLLLVGATAPLPAPGQDEGWEEGVEPVEEPMPPVEDDAVLRCEDACLESEARCLQACERADDPAVCEDGCESQAEVCMESCG